MRILHYCAEQTYLFPYFTRFKCVVLCTRCCVRVSRMCIYFARTVVISLMTLACSTYRHEPRSNRELQGRWDSYPILLSTSIAPSYGRGSMKGASCKFCVWWGLYDIVHTYFLKNSVGSIHYSFKNDICTNSDSYQCRARKLRHGRREDCLYALILLL